eukprot:NODE_1731_length_552_cov_509.339960_g1396_i0.p2 GENE.NODE_1731_length_552_cov_509.339960_g1396_i0~~NODE_1731_length_552_cov_509.339960_g1396_i0.p2  ORF type:complete len:112 (+),score=28.89 NODE_1731_length_552_cov_509.339960_g1396_i0:25-336(+)
MGVCMGTMQDPCSAQAVGVKPTVAALRGQNTSIVSSAIGGGRALFPQLLPGHLQVEAVRLQSHAVRQRYGLDRKSVEDHVHQVHVPQNIVCEAIVGEQSTHCQ